MDRITDAKISNKILMLHNLYDVNYELYLIKYLLKTILNHQLPLVMDQNID